MLAGIIGGLKLLFMSVQPIRGRGRPRLPYATIRIECMVPKVVYDRLVDAERAGKGYRTRVAANVLCNWAASTGAVHSTHQREIRHYHGQAPAGY